MGSASYMFISRLVLISRKFILKVYYRYREIGHVLLNSSVMLYRSYEQVGRLPLVN